MSATINGYFVFYDDGTPATVRPELPLPPYLTLDQARLVGWVIDRLDGCTRPSKKYPSGQCRWLSRPERPVDTETALAEVTRRKAEHRQQWNGAGLYKAPTYRLRNVHTGDVVMGDIL